MFSECCECDKQAVRYWGRYAYCKAHVAAASVAEPDAHKCTSCKREQPAHVSWRRDKPCGKCQ